MIKLYHGSSVGVAEPSVSVGRTRTDFGQGFYTTTSFEQAARWAKIRAERDGSRRAVVSVYEFDENLLNKSDLAVSHFSGVSGDWLNFVCYHRRHKEAYVMHHYDLVMGPVANDNLYATISLYENGNLSEEAAIVQLKTHTLFDQLSFHTQAALERLIHLEDVEVLL